MKPIFAALTALAALIQFTHADPLEVGAEAPRLNATDQGDAAVDLGTLYDAGTVLVYFYPRAGTPGCTAQACSLRDAYATLQERGVTVVGVSTDPVERLASFASDQHLPFTLVADPDHAIVDAFGVPLRAGHAARQAFLVHQGRIVWRDLAASTEQQAADVLAALDQLQADSTADPAAAPDSPAPADPGRATPSLPDQ